MRPQRCPLWGSSVFFPNRFLASSCISVPPAPQVCLPSRAPLSRPKASRRRAVFHGRQPGGGGGRVRTFLRLPRGPLRLSAAAVEPCHPLRSGKCGFPRPGLRRTRKVAVAASRICPRLNERPSTMCLDGAVFHPPIFGLSASLRLIRISRRRRGSGDPCRLPLRTGSFANIYCNY